MQLYRDHFQNYKPYNIPKAQLIIADIPYNIGVNAYASSPSWYKDGDNKNGESKLAKTSFFDTDNDFRVPEFMHFVNTMIKKEPKEAGQAGCMIVFCDGEGGKMERYYKLLFFLALCVLGLSMVVAADIGKVTVEITALEQQITQQNEQISALEEQIANMPPKMPVNEFEEMGNKLPSNEIKVETEQDGKASRSAESRTSVLMRVTAYDLSYESCKKNKNHPEYGIGASGAKVTENHSIAAGPEIPFGTKVFIPAFKDKPNGGIFTVEDRGSAIKENCLDIFIGESKHDECAEFGVQYLDVFVLDDLHESR